MDYKMLLGAGMVAVAAMKLAYPYAKTLFTKAPDVDTEVVPEGLEGYVAAIMAAAGDTVPAETILAYISVGMRASQVRKFQAGVKTAKGE